MIGKHTRDQRINYLRSLSDRSPEEDKILQKLIDYKSPNIYSATTVKDYQKQKIKKYYSDRNIKNKIKKFYQSK